MFPHLHQQLLQHRVGHHRDLLHRVLDQAVLHHKLLGDEGDGGLGDLEAEKGVGQAVAVNLGVPVHRQVDEEAAAVGPGQLQRQVVLLTKILKE